MTKISRPVLGSLAAALAAAFLLASLVFPQSRSAGTTSISGQVLSADGKPVPGALVILQTSYGRGPRSTRTNAEGRFTFSRLRPGLYELNAHAGGKWSEWLHNRLTRLGQPAEVTLRLTLSKEPPKTAPQVALAGKIREWTVPAENSLPHDPAADPSGHVWLALQRANQVARLDPATGAWKLFTSPTANSGPHGITSDAQGNIWYTENSAGKIGRVDGKTGVVTEYATLKARDPHTPLFGPDGALWFTAQQANVIGRLDPKTREMKEYPVPTPNARPYGIVLGPDAALWFCEFGTNKLGRLDPKTGAITEFEIPLPDARPRRLTVAGSMIYFSDFRAGHLGRLDVEQKIFRYWPSPGGPASQPYGIEADSAGDIWYCEFAGNQLVHFAPKTETFQAIPLPSPKSEVRNMVRDAAGHLWLALSGANKVAIVE
jgi:virginiamycin B lyase